jgi:deazaflavin-dependent oxidoreductase (nitroreductase family)
LSPSELDAVKKEKVIHVTTVGRKTSKPHVVELWFATGDGKLYLSHEGKRTDWMKNIETNPKIGVRIGDMEFSAEAKIVKSGAPFEAGKKALYEKYYGRASKEVLDDWFSLSEVVQLTPT